MRRYYGNEKVEPGIYFCFRQLSFKSLDEEGRLPGTPECVYRQVPAVALLVIGPLLGLAYAIFLPLIGFVMLGRIVLAKLAEVTADVALASLRVLRPAWQPARAFLARHKRSRTDDEDEDAWAEEVRAEIEEAADEEDHA